MPLEKDNQSHRALSNSLDQNHCGKGWYTRTFTSSFGMRLRTSRHTRHSGDRRYDKAVRPVVHGTYHTARAISSGNGEEWARAKDQYSKVCSTCLPPLQRLYEIVSEADRDGPVADRVPDGI